MRYLLVLGLLISLLVSGCEFITPRTSNALSQTRQQEELSKQTEQIKRQTNAIEQLTDSVQQLTRSQSRSAGSRPDPSRSVQ